MIGATQIAVLARAHHPRPLMQRYCIWGFTRPTCVLPALVVVVLLQGHVILQSRQPRPKHISATETVLCYIQRIQMQTAETR
eukprot:COSAG02_NODE_370_length_23672_cov_318.104738_16_plen_82_part_00